MAFSFAITDTSYFGNKKVVLGTFTSAGGSTGGDILTGLTNCDAISLTQKGSAVTTGAPVVNETFPVAGGAITIVTDANVVGTFIAYGY